MVKTMKKFEEGAPALIIALEAALLASGGSYFARVQDHNDPPR
jgi:hypothetical protein